MTVKRLWLGYFAALFVAVGLVVWGAALFFSALEAEAQMKITPGGGGGLIPPGASAATTVLRFGPEEFDLDIATTDLIGTLAGDTRMSRLLLVDGGDSGFLTNFAVPADWAGESVGVYLYVYALAAEDDEVLLEARYLPIDLGDSGTSITAASTVLTATVDVRTTAGSGGDVNVVVKVYKIDLGDMTGFTAGQLGRITIMRDGDGGADDWEQTLYVLALEMTP